MDKIKKQNVLEELQKVFNGVNVLLNEKIKKNYEKLKSMNKSKKEIKNNLVTEYYNYIDSKNVDAKKVNDYESKLNVIDKCL